MYQTLNNLLRTAPLLGLFLIPGALSAQATSLPPAEASTGSGYGLLTLQSSRPDLQATADDRGLHYSVRGGLIGLGVGLVAGHLIKSSWRDAACTGPGCAPPTEFSSMAAYVYFPLAGAGLGALIGAALEPSPWIPAISPGLGGAQSAGLTWHLETR